MLKILLGWLQNGLGTDLGMDCAYQWPRITFASLWGIGMEFSRPILLYIPEYSGSRRYQSST